MLSEWRKPHDANSTWSISWDGTLEDTPTKMNPSNSSLDSVTTIVLSTRTFGAPHAETKPQTHQAARH